jgi:hypothetical protein
MNDHNVLRFLAEKWHLFLKANVRMQILRKLAVHILYKKRQTFSPKFWAKIITTVPSESILAFLEFCFQHPATVVVIKAFIFDRGKSSSCCCCNQGCQMVCLQTKNPT